MKKRHRKINKFRSIVIFYDEKIFNDDLIKRLRNAIYEKIQT